METIECPGCAEPMRSESHAGVMLDRCDNCGALWFDKGELQRVLKRVTYRSGLPASSDIEPVLHQEGGTCPRCSDSVLRHSQVASVDATICGGCHGFLLPALSLRSLAERPGPADAGVALDTMAFGPLYGLLSAVVRALDRAVPK